jgi:hypothetical protein
MKAFRLITVIVGAVLFSACSAGDASVATPVPDYTRVSDATFAFDGSVPAPQGDVLLRVTGKIGASNVPGENAVEFDLAALEALGVVEFATVDIVQDVQEHTYRGVLLADVMRAVQAADDAATLYMLAVDDYQVEIPITDLAEYAVLIATHKNADYLALETFGPLRIVYPITAPIELDDRWIWTLKNIDVQ